jgi:hypothetical protein
MANGGLVHGDEFLFVLLVFVAGFGLPEGALRIFCERPPA